MPGERQRRPLDPTTKQPIPEIAVKTPQCIEVNGVLINPHTLHELLPAGGTHREKCGLIHERKPIVRPRIIIGCTVSKGCAHKTPLVDHAGQVELGQRVRHELTQVGLRVLFAGLVGNDGDGNPATDATRHQGE